MNTPISVTAEEEEEDGDLEIFDMFKKLLATWIRCIDSLLNAHPVNYETTRILSPTEQAHLSDDAQQLFYQRLQQGTLDSQTTERTLLACTLEEDETIDAPVLDAMIDVSRLNPDIPLALLLAAAHQAIEDQKKQKVRH